jgi:predicted Zn-dependent protease
MHRTASLVAVGLLAVAGCPGGGTGGKGPKLIPDTPPIDDGADLPAVASTIVTTTSEPTANHDPASASPLLAAMASENERWMKALVRKDEPAYYLAYQIIEQRAVNIDAEGGAIINDSDETARNLDVEIRVGSPRLDNTRPLADDPNGFNTLMTRRGVIPFGDEPDAIKNHLWLETDRRYREAVQQLTYVKQDQLTLSKARTRAPDFAPSEPVTYSEPVKKLEFDKATWVERLKACSAKALSGKATRATCSVVFQLNTVWFVNSEGTQIQQSYTNAQLSVSVGVKADDGQGLSRLEQRFGRTPADLPGQDEVDNMIKTVTDDLTALWGSKLSEPYVGPAILEGRAAGVFFHEVFGHRIEGHRQKDETEGNTFSSYVGKQIAPEWLSVYDDPTLVTLNGMQLNGFYRFDDEGVAAQHVPLVDKGVLVGFDMSRDPIDGFPKSNGHGRKSPGLKAVARQGNLVVEAARSVERKELEQMLIDEIKKQGRPYGMIFTDISSGFTLTSAFTPQAFKVNPVMAYKLYPDGKRELVRGIDIGGTPLIALQSIRAASREVETFNGVCGAESGWVPVSASAPSLLVEKVEIEKDYIPTDRPPVLGAPEIQAGGAP